METGDQAPATAGRVTRVLVAIGLVLVVVGGAAWWFQTPTTSPTPQTVQDPAPGVAAPPAQEVLDAVPPPREQRAKAEPGAPERLEVPALDIDAPVVPIGAPGGVLTPPSDPQTLGWWADGARPGARHGSALVTGHTVSAGGGAMDDLEELERGDRVWMRTDRGRIAYDVRTVVILGKGDLAEQAQRLFDQRVSGRLVLITCEDWNGAEYLSNVVVTATPSA
ncbi:MAG: class F sortase [Nocardioides sp.]